MCTLPPWLTLLSFPSLRVAAPSMELFRPPCHLFFLRVPWPCCHFCYLLKDYYNVASAEIKKSNKNPSASETCASKAAQQNDFKFLLCTYHMNDSTLQCITKFLEACPLHRHPLPFMPQLHTPSCFQILYWSIRPIQRRCNPQHIYILKFIYWLQ